MFTHKSKFCCHHFVWFGVRDEAMSQMQVMVGFIQIEKMKE